MKIIISENELLVHERSLISEGRKQRLREKEFSVLQFLCNKYPLPVTTEELKNEVWRGRYVSPHCIAQVIWSLRLILGDKDKKIITTISKLGYKLEVEPEFSHAITEIIHSNMLH